MNIKKIDANNYQIKILKKIDINNIPYLKELTTNIIKKIKKNNKLRKDIVLNIYPSTYETIIILKDYYKLKNLSNITEVKINIHTDTIFLYQIEYPTNENYNGIIYYYQDKYYLKLKNITKEKHLYLTEHSLLTFQDTNRIVKDGIKIKI